MKITNLKCMKIDFSSIRSHTPYNTLENLEGKIYYKYKKTESPDFSTQLMDNILTVTYENDSTKANIKEDILEFLRENDLTQYLYNEDLMHIRGI